MTKKFGPFFLLAHPLPDESGRWYWHFSIDLGPVNVDFGWNGLEFARQMTARVEGK